MYCARTRKYVWQSWKQVCEYYDFKDVEFWKNAEAKGMVLEVLDKP